MRFLLLGYVLFLSSCSHYKWKYEEDLEKSSNKIVLSKVPKYIDIEQDGLVNHFTIKNNSSETLYIVFKDSHASYLGTTYRLISGETTGRNVDRASPDEPIASKTKSEISFYTPGNIEHTWRKDSINPVKFEISVRKGSSELDKIIIESYGKFVGEFETDISSSDRFWCMYTGWMYGGYCWFVKPDESEIEAAKNIARKKFGENVVIEYVGKK